MAVGIIRISGTTPWLTPVTTFLVAVIMLLSAPFPGVLAADIHDPIVGRADVSDDAVATSGIANEQRNSDVAIDHLGRIHVVWEDERSGHFQIMYSRSDDGARSFGPSILVNTHYGQGLVLFKPSMAVDGDGNPHVVWEDPRNTPSTSIDIYYARSYDGGDSFGPNIRVNSDTANRPQITPNIAIASDGKVHVVYASGVGSAADIYISTSTDIGTTFGTMVEVTDETGAALQQNPMVAVDVSGLAHIVWTDQRSGDLDIYYAYRNQQGLVSSNVLVNDNVGGTTQRAAAIAVDDTGP